MSTKITLQDRERALEEEFFRKKEQETLDRLRENMERERTVAELKEISGIRDEAVLGHLADAGVRAETLMAFTIVPLVTVAWADGTVKDPEREAVLRAAHDAGIQEGTPAHGALDRMLRERPPVALFEAWVAYTGELFRGLPAAERDEVAADIVRRARDVAEVAGGLLGLGGMSEAEEAVIRRIEAAFA